MSTSVDSDNDAAAFYGTLAPVYDTMTRYHERFSREEIFFRELVCVRPVRTAIDAGCGSGFHAVLLARLGVAVTAVDAAPEMLSRARAHAAAAGVGISTHCTDLRALDSAGIPPADAIVCMGNTLAHLLNENDLGRALSSFHALLRPGGTLVVQMLNYDRFLLRREDIVDDRTVEGTRFVRRTTSRPPTVRFSIDITPRDGATVTTAVELYPWTSDEILRTLASAGFTLEGLFGSVDREPYDPERSPNLLITARRIA